MKITSPGAHLDHLLRQTRNHHVQLSSMADLKANILMTLASVVITLSIRYVTDPLLKWTTFVLMAFCLLTIILAAYAVMPKISVGLKNSALPKPDVDSPFFNILFFADFLRMDYDEYEENMETVLNDPSKVYEVQVREIYSLGKYLSMRKYRFVRLAYIAFIIGVATSGAVLLLTTLLM